MTLPLDEPPFAYGATYVTATRVLSIFWSQNIQAIGAPVGAQVLVWPTLNNRKQGGLIHGISGNVQTATMTTFTATVPGPIHAAYVGSWIHSLSGVQAPHQDSIPVIVL